MRKIDDATADKMIGGLQLLLEGTQVLNEVSRLLAKQRIPPPLRDTLPELEKQFQSPDKAERVYVLSNLLSKAQDELGGQ